MANRSIWIGQVTHDRAVQSSVDRKSCRVFRSDRRRGDIEAALAVFGQLAAMWLQGIGFPVPVPPGPPTDLTRRLLPHKASVFTSAVQTVEKLLAIGNLGNQGSIRLVSPVPRRLSSARERALASDSLVRRRESAKRPGQSTVRSIVTRQPGRILPVRLFATYALISLGSRGSARTRPRGELSDRGTKPRYRRGAIRGGPDRTDRDRARARATAPWHGDHASVNGQTSCSWRRV